MAVAVKPRVVCNQSYTTAFERFEAVAAEHVNAGEHGPQWPYRRRGAIDGGARLDDRDCGCERIEDRRVRRRGDARRDNRSDERAQPRHVTVTCRVNSIRKHDYKCFARRVKPQARAGEAGVAERADREEVAAIT